MTDFNALAIPPAILDRLHAAQFTAPTPIQAASIPLAIAGRDLLATAPTGTGKTLAFLVPALSRLLAAPPRRGIRVLILTPTRELAMQIAAAYAKLRPRGLPEPALLVGGVSERPQLDALRRGAALVVATPGRLEDFEKRGLLELGAVELLVLDEADRMLDIGFLPAIRRIVAALPRARQTLCYSATMAPEVEKLAGACMSHPERVSLGSTLKPAASVRLRAYAVADGGKPEMLQSLLRGVPGRSLVFARTKRGAERLAKHLVRDGFSATMIHGNRSQSQRTKALEGFQRGAFRVLVATDVAARGIHVQQVAHVINYDFPAAADDFVHRVGRTGRAGESGLASTLVARAELADLERLERHLHIRIERAALPEMAAAAGATGTGAPAGLAEAVHPGAGAAHRDRGSHAPLAMHAATASRRPQSPLRVTPDGARPGRRHPHRGSGHRFSRPGSALPRPR